jgi:hypothetical protein
MAKKEAAKKGRPPTLDENEKKKVVELLKFGLTESQICEALGFTRRALQYVKAKDEPFFHSIREARKISDAKVERALYERAIGYQHQETKYMASAGKFKKFETIKIYPPDVDACRFWLTNRKSENWKEKHDIDFGKGTAETMRSIAELISGRRKTENERLAKGEDPALVYLGRAVKRPTNGRKSAKG